MIGSSGHVLGELERRGRCYDLSWTLWAGPQKVGRMQTYEGQHGQRRASRQACPDVRAAGVAAGSPRGGSPNLKPLGCFLLDGGEFKHSPVIVRAPLFLVKHRGLKKVSLGELYVCSHLLTVSWGCWINSLTFSVPPGLLG